MKLRHILSTTLQEFYNSRDYAFLRLLASLCLAHPRKQEATVSDKSSKAWGVALARLPRRLLRTAMWLFWPLRWCFGTERNKAKPVAEPQPTHSAGTKAASIDELRQQLRGHDFLGTQRNLSITSEADQGENVVAPGPADRLELPADRGYEQPIAEPDGEGSICLPSPTEIVTPAIRPRRPFRSTGTSTPAPGSNENPEPKAAGSRKRANPESGLSTAPSLTVLIPNQDLLLPDQATPTFGFSRSPLPILTPALPIPPQVPSCDADSVGLKPLPNPEDGLAPALLATPGGNPSTGPEGVAPSAGMFWESWGAWDLRSPSSEIPRTPVLSVTPAIKPAITPMVPGSNLGHGEERILRRRNTPFEVRVERDLIKYGQRPTKSVSPTAGSKGQVARMKSDAKQLIRKENVPVHLATPPLHQKAWSVTPSSATSESGSGLDTPFPLFPEFVTTPGMSSGGGTCTPQIVGINNPPSRFREDKRLRVHETPFESRVERFIEKEDSYKRRLSASMAQSS